MLNTTMENRSNLSQGLLDFIGRCPTSYHTVEALKEQLLQQGFTELFEHQSWALTNGGKYFVIRNGASLLAFTLPIDKKGWEGVRAVASHNDSPALKLKDIYDASVNGYCRLNVEKYGGMICSTWLDRPLSIAGRVLLSGERGIMNRLVDQKRPVALIPNVAIHMERNINDGKKYNPQVDMLPIVGLNKDDSVFKNEPLVDSLTDSGEILSHDLYLYVCEKGYLWGRDDEMITAPRLDDLMCVYGALVAFLNVSSEQVATHVNLMANFDNEEIGSQTLQGAASSFLEDTLERILYFHGNDVGDPTAAYAQLAQGWMLSADNAHAIHPNHPEYADAKNSPTIGGGVALKFNAQQRYATDALGAAVFRKICMLSDIKVQSYVNRSDIPGGSTLGNIAQTRVPLHTVDIGIPQLAMHSAMETAGTADFVEYIRACDAFYRARIACDGENILTVKI